MSATFDIIKESEAPRSRRGMSHPRVYEPLLQQLGPGDVGRFHPNNKPAANVRKALAFAARSSGIPIATWIVDGVVYCKLKETV